MEEVSERLEKPKKKALKIFFVILGLIILVAIVITIVFIVINMNREEEVTNEEEMQKISNNTFQMYLDGDYDEMRSYYDELIKEAKNEKEKIELIKNRIEDYNVFCGWGCSEQILEDVHTVYNYDKSSETRDWLCFYEDMYLDIEPIEGCSGMSVGEM